MKRSRALSQLDLNLLHTFFTVVRSGGVGAAGRTLGRTQPAISARLRQLENEVGMKLFERVGRGVALTPLGRAIEGPVAATMESVHGVFDQIRSAQAEPSGLLRIGTLPTVSRYLLARPIARFLDRWPAARIELTHAWTHEQLPQLGAGELDLVISVGPLPREKLEVQTFGWVEPRLAAPAGRVARTISVRRLSEMELIGYGQVGDLFFDQVWRFIEAHRLDRRVRLVVANIQTIKGLILAGAGVSILPGYTIVERELAAARVRELRFVHPVWFAARKTSLEIPLIRRFCQLLRRTPGPR